MVLRLEEELQTAQPTVAWGMAMTKTVAAAVRRSNEDVVAKSACIAARASGNRKQRTGIDDTGYGKDATYGHGGGGQTPWQRVCNEGKEGNNTGAMPATTTTAQCWQ
jgi:hypothetical protein